jgi:hypothetical protein
MYIPFHSLPDTSRIWIYQATRPLIPEYIEEISARLRNFTENWAAHGRGLAASFDIRYSRFIIIAVNEYETLASGCSIDASVAVLKSIERDLNISILERKDIAYKEQDGSVVSVPMEIFKAMVIDNDLDKNTIVFNNMLQTKGDLESLWEVPMEASWHKRYLKLAV